MSSKYLLKQLRRGCRASINEDPTTISISVYPTKDDGFGKQVPDLSQSPTIKTHKVRVSHKRGVVSENQVYDSGLDSDRDLFMHTDWLFTGSEGQAFEYEGRTWRIGVLDPMTKFGGIYGYVAQLYVG